LVVATTSENDADVAKAVAWLGNGPIAVSGDSYVFKHSLDPLYAAYYFQTDAFHRQKRRFITGTKVKRVSGADLARIEIPVPPIAIQREIVSILTSMEALEAELEAELEARRRQYAHYVDTCFTSELVDADVRPLGAIGSFRRGRRITKSELIEQGLGAIHYGEMYTYYGTCAYATKSFVALEKRPALSLANPGDLVIAGTGENVEDLGRAVAWLGQDPVAVHDDCFILSHSLEPAFVSYFFQSASFHQQKRRFVAGAKVSRISSRDLARIEIPVPPADEQKRVVHILATLEQLTSDLAIGIPAELAARRQQYEYYRDRLFDFSRLAA
jgi:type I restriction enzyme S subunit